MASFLPAVLPLMLVEGCDQLKPATPIKEVLAAPAGFEGRAIRLKGRVKQITIVVVMQFQALLLSVRTGWRRSGLPSEGFARTGKSGENANLSDICRRPWSA